MKFPSVQLEQQNEALVVQNARAAQQIQVLNACASKVHGWRNSLVMSNSVTVSEQLQCRSVVVVVVVVAAAAAAVRALAFACAPWWKGI